MALVVLYYQRHLGYYCDYDLHSFRKLKLFITFITWETNPKVTPRAVPERSWLQIRIPFYFPKHYLWDFVYCLDVRFPTHTRNRLDHGFQVIHFIARWTSPHPHHLRSVETLLCHPSLSLCYLQNPPFICRLTSSESWVSGREPESSVCTVCEENANFPVLQLLSVTAVETMDICSWILPPPWVL